MRMLELKTVEVMQFLVMVQPRASFLSLSGYLGLENSFLCGLLCTLFSHISGLYP